LKTIDLTSEFASGASLRNGHGCTHIDAPAYISDDGKTIDQYKPEVFVGNAVLLDLTHKKPGQAIDDEDLEAAEERAGLAVREGEIVVLYTGCERSIRGEGASAGYPYLSENGAQYLEFKRVRMVATDAPDLDPPNSKNLPAHATLLRKEILVLENLCNLDKIEGPRFRLTALPLKVKASTSPVRALAILADRV
jgi:kynurenine formamidase